MKQENRCIHFKLKFCFPIFNSILIHAVLQSCLTSYCCLFVPWFQKSWLPTQCLMFFSISAFPYWSLSDPKGIFQFSVTLALSYSGNGGIGGKNKKGTGMFLLFLPVWREALVMAVSLESQNFQHIPTCSWCSPLQCIIPYLLSCPSNQSVERCFAVSKTLGYPHWPLSSSEDILAYYLNHITFGNVSIVLTGPWY